MLPRNTYQKLTQIISEKSLKNGVDCALQINYFDEIFKINRVTHDLYTIELKMRVLILKPTFIAHLLQMTYTQYARTYIHLTTNNINF